MTDTETDWMTVADQMARFTCPACCGSGEIQPGFDPQHVVACRRCHGSGEVTFLDDGEVA